MAGDVDNHPQQTGDDGSKHDCQAGLAGLRDFVHITCVMNGCPFRGVTASKNRCGILEKRRPLGSLQRQVQPEKATRIAIDNRSGAPAFQVHFGESHTIAGPVIEITTGLGRVDDVLPARKECDL